MTRSHGPPSQPNSARPAMKAAAPSSLSQPRTVVARGGHLAVGSMRRRHAISILRSALVPTGRRALMATLYSLDG